MYQCFYDLRDDLHIPGRWELGSLYDRSGQKLWQWPLRRGAPVQIEGPIRIEVERPGRSLDFSLADGGRIPIIHVNLAAVIAEKARDDVQLLPAAVDGHPDKYCVLNVLRVVNCIDDAACAEVQRYTEEDGEPDLVGEYRAVHGLRIDPRRVEGAQVFRPWGWPVVVIVSGEMKAEMQRVGATGALFEEV